MYKIGDIIPVIVTGIQDYGIFVKVDDEYSGLIHVSEIDNKFIKDIGNYVKENDLIYASIINVDEENKHLKLSIKYLNYNDNNYGKNKIKDNINGFLPVHDKLDEMIKEKLEELRKNDSHSLE